MVVQAMTKQIGIKNGCIHLITKDKKLNTASSNTGDELGII